MELESKFIEGTNNQYSIRSDGAVISHYKFYKNQYSSSKIIREYIFSPVGKYGYVYPHKGYRVNPQFLLAKYFGFRFCAECKNKFSSPAIKNIKCDKCKKANANKSCYKWKRENKEKRKEGQDRYTKQSIEEISINYVARRFGIPVSTLSIEAYEEYKILLKTKRLLAQKLNINIKSLQ
jgi:hypothetical protein